MTYPIPKRLLPGEGRVYRGFLASAKTPPADPKEFFGRFGENLYRLLTAVDQQASLVRVLWKHYLADCARTGVKPYEPEVKGGEESR